MSYARLAGVACLIGGFFLMIDAGIALLPDGATCPLADIVGACAKLGVIAGTLGFLSLRVARPGWLAIVGAGLALAGTLTQIAGVLSLAFFPHADQILTPLGSGLITLGMTGWALLPCEAVSCLAGRRGPLCLSASTSLPNWWLFRSLSFSVEEVNSPSIQPSFSGGFPGCSWGMSSSPSQQRCFSPSLKPWRDDGSEA
jgi:hypothetical protein